MVVTVVVFLLLVAEDVPASVAAVAVTVEVLAASKVVVGVLVPTVGK